MPKKAESTTKRPTHSVHTVAPKRLAKAQKTSEILQQPRWASSSDFVVPVLTGEEAVVLMKAAGIWTKTGKLAKSYR